MTPIVHTYTAGTQTVVAPSIFGAADEPTRRRCRFPAELVGEMAGSVSPTVFPAFFG